MPVAFRIFLCTASREPRRSHGSPPVPVKTVPVGSVVCSQINPSFQPAELPLVAAVRHEANQTSPAGARLRTPVEGDVHPL